MHDAEFDRLIVIMVGILNVGVAAIVAYALWRAVAPRGRSLNVVHTGRRVAGYACGAFILANFPKLFLKKSVIDLAETYLALILGTIFVGLLGFAIGWVVGKVFVKYEHPTLPTKSGEQA